MDYRVLNIDARRCCCLSIAVFLIGCAGLGAAVNAAAFANVFANKEQQNLLLASGETVPMEELKEATLVVNFWAVWCAPCRIEIPELNELHRQGRSAGSVNSDNKVIVLGVDFDRSQGEVLRSAITEMGIAFPVLTEASAEQLQLTWPEVLPVTLIVRHGKIMKTLQGQQSLESLLSDIESVSD